MAVLVVMTPVLAETASEMRASQELSAMVASAYQVLEATTCSNFSSLRHAVSTSNDGEGGGSARSGTRTDKRIEAISSKRVSFLAISLGIDYPEYTRRTRDSGANDRRTMLD